MAGINRNYKANLQSILAEHGKAFTESVEKCNELLLSVVGNPPDRQIFDSAFVAQVLTTILSHNLPEIANENGFNDMWIKGGYETLPSLLNPGILMETLKALTGSELNWPEVIANFQQTSQFMVRDKAGLYFLMNAIMLSSPMGHFPVGELYRVWGNNRLGQLSWIGQLVMYPDLFCFCDYHHRHLSTSCLKIPPDETNKDICNWLSLDLLEVLLRLADEYSQVVGEILIRRRDSSSIAPAINCPDLLLLGIVQVGLPFNTIRSRLVNIVICQLMLHHTNAVSVLNALWNTESPEMKKVIQQLVVNGLLSFYTQAPDDTGRLTKILEIAHELKPNGLGELFNVQNFQFAIDLACLASRRDFLKLDKFLSDKLQEHTDVFANQLVTFIMRRFPAHIVTNNVTPLSHETFQVMYHALQNRAQYAPSVHSEFQKLQVHLKNAQNAAKPADPHINSRTPITAFLGQSSTNQYSYGRGIEQPGVLNGSMTTPVFGTAPNGRPVGASTPTTPYSYPTSQLIPGSMDMRSQLSESMYRSGMTSGPPGWNNPPSGWSSRSTPIPAIADFRPAFAQQSLSGASSAVSQQLSNGGGILTDPRFSTDTPNVEQFSDEIQDEANSYFQQMFTDHNPLSVQDFIKQMYQFRHSGSHKDKKVLNCVIKNLFDEFKFFNEYPEMELKTTAEVYGRFINEGIVEEIQFAQAVRKVIEAILSPPNTPLFTFGIVALQACKSLLHRYPKVCIMIAQNDSFAKFPPELYEYIHAGCTGNIPDSNNIDPTHPSMMHHADLRNRNTPALLPNHLETVTQAAQNAVRIPMAPTGPSMMAVSNTEILERGTERDGEKVILAEKKLAEEVSFLCNNLSFANLPNKVDDLRQILDKHDDTCRKWLAQYLVMKRITLEQNFHSLYNSFLVALNDEKLNHYVKQETLRNIKILLKSDKKHDTSSFDDRQLLKNLGHWLGLITIARNYPVMLDELNLRDLLLEAFYKGQQELLYVIPFVVKIIMASPKSMVFSPSCAWVQQILHILAEIHRQSDLKLSLKFEIEVLCKELRVDLQSLVSDGSLLTDDRITRLTQQLSDVATLTRPTDAPNSEATHFVGGPYDPAGRASTVQPAMYSQQRASATEGIEGAQNAARYQQSNAQVMPTPQFYYHEINIYEPIENQLTIPANLPLFQIFPQLASQCRKFITAAVAENIGGMVERSVGCAMSLTSEIINKDFAQCPDPQQMRKAYLQMMRSITAAIGMITTKEPLSATIITYLKNMFNHQIQQYGQADESLLRMIEETMVIIVEKNVEFACCYVVKTACEKAMIEIDKRMEDAIQRRKNGLKLEIPADIQAIIDKIPLELRPIDRLVKDEEMAVYNVFTTQMFGFKPSPIDDFGLDRSVFMKKKEGYHDVRQHINENALDDMLSDPTFFQSKAESIFREWMAICSQTEIRTTQPFGSHLFQLMQNHGIAINEENILKQIKTCLEICTDVSYRLLSRTENSSPLTANVRNRCYYTIDAFSKLVCLLIRNGDNINNTNKLQLLHRTLDLLTTSLVNDHEVRRREFNGLPFLRIFITMIKDLCQHDPAIVQIHWNIIEQFGHALYFIQPRRVPAFAFHWLEIVGHRVFISELLADPNAPHLTRAMYTQLLLAHLKFLAPSLRNVHLPKAVQDLYRGTLRVMLVVLHDFPELLCEFYYVFCDVIPPNCVQLRNLVLSAYPRTMRLPDPFSQSFAAIESLPDMDIVPKIAYEMFNLIPDPLRTQLDQYLTNRSDVTFLLDLSNKLESSNIAGCKYNVPVLNAIINFVGIRAITQLKESNVRISISSIAHSSYMDVFQNLAVTFCTEGLYLLFNALANQLRYPNAQTHYFACTILYLFKEAANDAIREQITRILFERLVSLRPHPWGLLITFIELIRNEQYKFWTYEFVHCAPEIERLFINVANACNVNVPAKYPNIPAESGSGGI